MTDPRHYAYYDKLYAGKDYRAEAETVLDLAARLSGRPVRRLLDVGCGTGSHALEFAEQGVEVLGVDVDAEAVALAERKARAWQGAGARPRFVCGELAAVDAAGFDCATALFNVVNYIARLDALAALFREIAARLSEDGVFVFDCWNGVAALLDPPREEVRRIETDGETIEIALRPHLDRMAQRVWMEHRVTVTPKAGEAFSYTFDYAQTLWTPLIVHEALEAAGFMVARTAAWMDPETPATENTWKMMFAAQCPAGSR